jgi:hypothetical protein
LGNSSSNSVTPDVVGRRGSVARLLQVAVDQRSLQRLQPRLGTGTLGQRDETQSAFVAACHLQPLPPVRRLLEAGAPPAARARQHLVRRDERIAELDLTRQILQGVHGRDRAILVQFDQFQFVEADALLISALPQRFGCPAHAAQQTGQRIADRQAAGAGADQQRRDSAHAGVARGLAEGAFRHQRGVAQQAGREVFRQRADAQLADAAQPDHDRARPMRIGVDEHFCRVAHARVEAELIHRAQAPVEQPVQHALGAEN